MADRIKDIVPRILGGGTPPSQDLDCWEDGDIVWVTPTDFSRSKDHAEISESERKITRAGLNASAANLLPKNTIIMASRATIGTVRIAGTELATNQGFISFVCDEQKLHHRFLYYAICGFLGECFAEVAPGTTFCEISRGKAKLEPIAFPLLPDQQRIASYLDASCAAIDTAVSAKRCQLEILDALRSTVIQEFVTKGLDPGVEMMDSCIDWLPEIPRHWHKARLKRHVRMMRGQFSHRPRNDPAFYGGPYPFIQTGSISAVDKFITEFTQTLNEDGLRISKLFPADTNVMTITGAKIAEVAVTTFEACFPDSIVGFVPDHCVNRDYLYYLLVAMKSALLRAMVVTTQPNINYVQIGGNYIPLPPVREQELIAKHIERRLQGIKEVQKSLNKQIAALTAYRNSLIHECITGQRRVAEPGLMRVKAHG